jgi:tetratricopeptide (TPR) repeat protein/transglutaminase-like putative cysteine protease
MRCGRTSFALAFFACTSDKYRQVMTINRWCALSLSVLLAVSLAGRAQTSPPHAPAKDDYSREAAVIEEMATKIAFDNDGKSVREQSTRVRVQTDVGVQQWGLLTFPFQSATQTVEIDYVRVRKTDGSTVVTPPDNVQDLDAEITRSAPFYSDLREKHVAVKGLGKGDTLEYAAHWRTTKPLIPGQFWFQYNFHHEGVVLDERVEVKVLAARAVKVKGPQATQTVTTDGDSRIYVWTYSKRENAKEPGSDEKKTTESARGVLPPPDVQISSFQTWEEVGGWYWNLQKDRVEPTAAIRAKAAELTKGLTDDGAKLRALYGFVSTQYRYIGIAFGIGRYQPHAADDVLTNNYGDCKDKHTLLASLLQASGIKLYPALINSSFKLDSDVPSPAQFDHIIGYLPRGKDQDDVWLDTTLEIAPFGYLAPRLREKQALVMSGDKSIQLVPTPGVPPLPNSEAFKIEGKLDNDGTLEATIEDTTRGDSEVVLRTAFRQVPQPQWKDLVQRISYAMGYAGTVSDVSASKPEAIGEPFHFSYSYNRKDYPDWKSDQRLTVPGMPFFMPPVRDDANYPVWLGPQLEGVSDSKVELPHGYQPQLPSNVDLKYDFAEYHASYSLDHGVLIAKRRLLTKVREVPVAEFDDYRSFLKNLQNDVNRYVYATSSNASSPKGTVTTDAPLSGNAPSFPKEMVGLPDSDSSSANQLEADAKNAMGRGDSSAALSALRRAVEVDPKFSRALLELVFVYMSSGKNDAAVEALRKGIESDPKQSIIRKAYAYVLTRLRRTDAAIDALREIVKIAPNDPEANSELGMLLSQQKRYAEALPYLETAAVNDGSPAAQYRLGSTYLRGGQVEKGTAVLLKVVEKDPKPDVLNDVAYDFAEANTSLPKALEYAQNAVASQEKQSHDVELSNLLPEDLACTRKIEMFWDTLGWVHFRLGHLEQAESYLHAAWLLSQGAVEADHLGQVYEGEKKTEKAIHMYRLALATPEANAPGGSWDETRHRLEHLTGAKAPTAMDLLRVDPNGSELSALRTVKLKRVVPGSATAEFFLLFSPGPKVESVEFISGSEKLKSADQTLTEAKFQVAFPEGSSARLVRRAILLCSPVSGCSAVLYTPDSVHSVN